MQKVSLRDLHTPVHASAFHKLRVSDPYGAWIWTSTFPPFVLPPRTRMLLPATGPQAFIKSSKPAADTLALFACGTRAHADALACLC
jgi:hypothetical protein